MMARHRRDPLDVRFWEKVDTSAGPDGCWLWTASKANFGYGQITRECGKPGMMKAHVASWLLHHGPVPEGLRVLHKCDVTACVNPRHLFLGTQAENMADMARKGRSAWGNRKPNAKLNEDAVRRIFAMRKRGLTHQRIADAFGVSHRLIGGVLEGRRWRQVSAQYLRKA